MSLANLTIFWGGTGFPSYQGYLKGAEDAARYMRDAEFKMQQTAFNKQMDIINQLQGTYTKYLSGTLGFSPEAMAGMRSQFLTSNSQTFNQAGQQVREALGARGNTGTNPIGGDYVAGLSNLLGARAGSQSQGLLGLQVQNALQAQNNMWNAGNLLSGGAAQLTGTQGVAGSGVSNALNTQAQVASRTGFGAGFLNTLGSAIGGLAGGMGGALIGGGMGSMGCWIAAAIFDGWDDPRTQTVRAYLFGDFRQSWYGRILTDLYLKYGKQVAKKPWAVRILKPLFELALVKANG